jgi:hypothetical protein
MKTKTTVFTFLALVAFLGSFNFAVAQLATNDDCSQAVQMNPSTKCHLVTGYTTGATTSLPVDVCAGIVPFPVRDVWYKFSATGSLTYMISAKPFTVPVVISLYTNSCNNLSYVACANSLGLGYAQLNIGVLPAGTYFYRVYSIGGAPVKFNTCVTALSPTKDESFDEEAESEDSRMKENSGFAAGTVSVSPNPSSGISTVSFFTESSGPYVLRVFNSVGNKVYSTQGFSDAGVNSLSIDLSSFGTGMYLVDVKGGGINDKVKVLVQ